jgi:hypothetical protein
MRLLGVIALGAAAALFATLAGTAQAHSPNGTATYLRVHPDPRLCPSPICGGWWASRVNRDDTVCGNGIASPQCYAASLDLSALKLTDEQAAALQQALATGTALVRGRLVRRPVGDPPPLDELDALVVTEVWLRSGRARGSGVVYRVEDNGVRCIRAPCFSWHASTLNTRRHRNVSDVDLAPSGAPPGPIARARAALSRTGVLVDGRIVAAGDGRALWAFSFWLRSA